MSFDARSRERLEALGRQLPQKLPPPSPPTAPAGDPGPGSGAVDNKTVKASDRRHSVETEQNPEQLFRRLMDVSDDGSVPAHLLERLRVAETQTPRRRPSPNLPNGAQPSVSDDRRTGNLPGIDSSRPKRSSTGRLGRPAATNTDPAFYAEFSQLLLEEDDGG